jgi:hypothetical protein
MSCNCKTELSDSYDIEEVEVEKISLVNLVISYVVKMFGFLILLLGLPIINLVLVWFMFNTLVLTKSVDIAPLLTKIGRKFSNNEDDDEEYEDEDLTEDDVTVMNVEDITEKGK